MTLINARRRFTEMGYEVERDVAPYRYKARRLGHFAWRRAACLDYLLEWAAAEMKKAAG